MEILPVLVVFDVPILETEYFLGRNSSATGDYLSFMEKMPPCFWGFRLRIDCFVGGLKISGSVLIINNFIENNALLNNYCNHISIQSFCLTYNLLVIVLFWVRDHCLVSWVPSCWTHFSVLVHKLKCLHQSHVLVWISANWQIVHRWMPYNSLSVYYVCCSVGNSRVISVSAQASKTCGNRFCDIWDQWNIHFSKATFFSGFQGVLHMREFGINWTC